jgi:hypothetical protein
LHNGKITAAAAAPGLVTLTCRSRHSGEPYYETFRAFYKTDTFLDAWLG